MVRKYTKYSLLYEYYYLSSRSFSLSLSFSIGTVDLLRQSVHIWWIQWFECP